MKYKFKKIINHAFIFTILLYLFFVNISTIYANSLDTNEITNKYPSIESESGVLIDAKTGLIIYEKNAKEMYYPASITKVMTGLLALENTKNLNERITMSHDAVYSLPYGSSHIAMDEDETLSIDDSMYALMLASANEVSNAIAEHIGETNEGFAKLMTKRAKELGAKNTNFVNPHGLHDDEHYSTPYDMSLILREAISNKKFVEYISTISHKIPPTEKQDEERPLYNSNKLIHQGGKNYNEYVIGGKTGYTNEAEHTLVSYAVKDNMELICVIMKGKKGDPYKDTNNLYEYGFDNLETKEVFNKNDYKEELSIKNNDGDIIGKTNGYVEKDVKLNVPKDFDENKLQVVTDLETLNKVDEDEVIGVLSIIYDGITLDEQEIHAKESIQQIVTDGEVVGKTKDEDEDKNFFTIINNFWNGGNKNPLKIIMSIVGVLAVGVLAILFAKLSIKSLKNYRIKKYEQELKDILGKKYSYERKRSYKYKQQ